MNVVLSNHFSHCKRIQIILHFFVFVNSFSWQIIITYLLCDISANIIQKFYCIIKLSCIWKLGCLCFCGLYCCQPKFGRSQIFLFLNIFNNGFRIFLWDMCHSYSPIQPCLQQFSFQKYINNIFWDRNFLNLHSIIFSFGRLITKITV